MEHTKLSWPIVWRLIRNSLIYLMTIVSKRLIITNSHIKIFECFIIVIKTCEMRHLIIGYMEYEKMKKRILVIDTAASVGGAMTVLQEFYKTVCSCKNDVEWFFLISNSYIESSNNIHVLIRPDLKKRWKRLLFDFGLERNYINSINPDIILSLQNTIPNYRGAKKVLYVHQALPFQTEKHFSIFDSKERPFAIIQYILGFFIKQSIRRADYTIVQTKWIKSAIKNQCRIPENKIHQIYPQVVNTKWKSHYVTTKVFFYPCGNAIYKDINVLEDACRVLDVHKVEFNTKITIDSPKSNNSISYCGRLAHEDVMKMYTVSCLVFPSYIETFGYPLAEARSAGSIIIAADCAFSRELLDGYSNAYFFTPHSSTELASLMEKVARGTICRKDTGDEIKGLSQNSWNKIIDLVINA